MEVTINLYLFLGLIGGLLYCLLSIHRHHKVINLLIEQEMFKEDIINKSFEAISDDISKINNLTERLNTQVEYIGEKYGEQGTKTTGDIR